MFCPKCGTENPETGRFCRSCGTDLTPVSKALSNKPTDNNNMWGGDWSDDSTSYKYSKKEKTPQTSEDIYSEGIKSAIAGIGFFIVSMVLFFTGVAGGHRWWWAMLFPAFFSLANGISQMVKAKRIEKRSVNANPIMQNQVASTPQNLNLPPTQTEYVKPQSSIYDTGELVAPPSVTEHTTKHLEMNSEGETMTLPKK